MSLEEAEKLFYEHGAELTQPRCRIIYTISQPLYFSNKIRQIVLQYFDEFEVLKNINVLDKNENLAEGYNILKEVALKRMEEHLITESALDKAIRFSGGVLSEFVRLIRRGANTADMEGRTRIEVKDIELAIEKIRNNYIRILSEKDYEVLRRVLRSKEKIDGGKFNKLLFSLAILEYSNGEVWYDVHPVIKGILK